MNLNKIFFGFLLTFIFLFYIINGTFNTSKIENKNNFDLESFRPGIFELINNGSGGIKFINSQKITNDKVYIEKINYVDNFYFLGEYKKNNSNIKLDKGIFFFDINKLSNNYNIAGKGFNIKVDSPGKFFIDLRDEKKIKILALDSILKVELLDLNNGEKMTHMILYPHMTGIFDKSRIKLAKNIDLFRLESIFIISYIPDKLFTENKEINKIFLDKTGINYDKIASNFFSIVLSLNYNSEYLEKYNVNNIKLLDFKEVSGIEYIQNYFNLFLNKGKKIVFYQNNVIENLNKLFEINNKNNLKEITINIKTDLEILKKIDDNNTTDKILIYYYDNLLKINSIDYIDNTSLLFSIINENKKISSADFYINKIYSLFNSGDIDESKMNSNLINYLRLYSKENNLTLDNLNTISLKTNSNTDNIYYISFFLKNYLNYHLLDINDDNLAYSINILNYYISINSIIAQKNLVILGESFIVEHYEILSKLLKNIRLYYFKEDLLSNSLLDLDRTKSIKISTLKDLDYTIRLFFRFYDRNSKYLTNKNISYKDKYIYLNESYNQISSALTDYDNYINNYKTKNNIDNNPSIEDNKETENQNNSQITDNNTNNEDKTFIVFKKINLLGTNGDFNKFKSILSINYDDIDVNLSNGIYNIVIKKSKLTNQLDDSSKSIIYGNLSSDYVYSEKDHYFKNLKIIITDNSWEKTYIGGNQIYVSQDIQLLDFEKIVKTVLKEAISIHYIYSKILNNLSVSKINILYNKDDSFDINFDYNGKKINIFYKNSKIIKLSKDENNVLNNKIIDYTEIAKYFNLIK